MIKYKTGSLWSSGIEQVEVVRETESSVFVMYGTKERRESKRTDYHNFHDTYENAIQWYIEGAIKEIHSAKSRLESAEKILSEIKAKYSI
jgi:hypothetical protein